LIYPLNISIIKPEERLCFRLDVEFGGIKSALKYVIQNKSKYYHKRIFIRIDSQSMLIALKKDLNRKYKYLGINTSRL